MSRAAGIPDLRAPQPHPRTSPWVTTPAGPAGFIRVALAAVQVLVLPVLVDIDVDLVQLWDLAGAVTSPLGDIGRRFREFWV